MEVFVIKEKASYFALAPLTLLTVAALWRTVYFSDHASTTELAIWLMIASVLVASAICEQIASRKVIEIDRDSDAIQIYTHSWLLIPKIVRYRLSEFSTVISYITALGKSRKNIVSLLTSKREELSLGAFEHGTQGKGFFSIPRPTEAARARAIREQLCSYAMLNDEGFRTDGVSFKSVKSPKIPRGPR